MVILCYAVGVTSGFIALVMASVAGSASKEGNKDLSVLASGAALVLFGLSIGALIAGGML